MTKMAEMTAHRARRPRSGQCGTRMATRVCALSRALCHYQTMHGWRARCRRQNEASQRSAIIVSPHRHQPAGVGFGVVECRCLQAPGRDGQGNRRQPNTFRAHTSCMLRARALQWPDRVGVRVEHRVIVACARCAPAAGVGATAGHACAWSARQLQPACMHATPPARCMARPG